MTLCLGLLAVRGRRTVGPWPGPPIRPPALTSGGPALAFILALPAGSEAASGLCTCLLSAAASPSSYFLLVLEPPSTPDRHPELDGPVPGGAKNFHLQRKCTPPRYQPVCLS